MYLLPLHTETQYNLRKHSNLRNWMNSVIYLLKTNSIQRVVFYVNLYHIKNIWSFIAFSYLYDTCRNNGASKIRIGLSNQVCNLDT